MATKNIPPLQSPFHLCMSEIFIWNGSKFYKTNIVNMEHIRPLKNKNLNHLCG